MDERDVGLVRHKPLIDLLEDLRNLPAVATFVVVIVVVVKMGTI
jgi:hypothetical protein